ncbi:hypothetical protein [Streptomyces spiralis]
MRHEIEHIEHIENIQDIKGGEAMTERPAKGVPLRDALAVADPHAWEAGLEH